MAYQSDSEMDTSISFDAHADLIPSSQNDIDYFPELSETFSSERSSFDEPTMRLNDKQIVAESVRLRLSSDPVEARNLVDSLPFRSEGWCRLCTLKPSKEGGYIQVSWQGANKFATLQEVVLWASGCALRPGEQCSHRCCQPACLNLGHVVAESELENQRRKGCLVWVDCRHCALKILVCVHGGQKCIQYCEGYVDSEAFEAAGVH